MKQYAKGCGIGCLVLIPVAFFCILAAAVGITFGNPEVLNGMALKYGALALLLLVLTVVCYRQASKNDDDRKEKRWIRAGHVMAVGTVLVELLVFFYFWGAMDYNKTDLAPAEGWAAENIELPHLEDGNRYTANPDLLLSKETVATVDSIMRLLDRELDIEGAVVVVRRMKNADIFRFCQDLFDRYGIGKSDRGIVIAVAVDDRQARIHTGTSLEADFTDLETNRLLSTYLLPEMKQGDTDGGVRLLTEACYRHLSNKDMPKVQTAEGASSDNPDPYRLMGIFFAIIVVSLFIIYTAWHAFCVDHAFAFFSSSSGGGSSSDSYSSYSSSSSTSSRSSGGYSGGRSSGGGSTIRW